MQIPENTDHVQLELEARRRPGRPPVHVWVDLPDELLSPEQKRKKRAILLRRARQQRLYERRKLLRAGIVSTPSEKAVIPPSCEHAAGAPPASRSQAQAERIDGEPRSMSADSGQFSGRANVESGVEDTWTAELSYTNAPSGARKNLEGQKIFAGRPQLLPTPGHMGFRTTDTQKRTWEGAFPDGNKPSGIRLEPMRGALACSKPSLNAPHDTDGAHIDSRYPDASLMKHAKDGVFVAQPTPLEGGSYPCYRGAWEGPSREALRIHPVTSCALTSAGAPGYVSAYGEITAAQLVPSYVMPAAALMGIKQGAPAIAGKASVHIGKAALPSVVPASPGTYGESRGIREPQQTPGMTGSVLVMSPVTPPDLDVKHLEMSSSQAWITKGSNERHGQSYLTRPTVQGLRTDQISVEGQGRGTNICDANGMLLKAGHQGAHQKTLHRTKAEAEVWGDVSTPRLLESRVRTAGTLRNISTADMRVFQPDALLKLYQSVSDFEQRLFVRLTLPPACIDEELVAVLVSDEENPSVLKESDESASGSGGRHPEENATGQAQSHEHEAGKRRAIASALSVFVDHGLLRRASSCYIANASWREFVQSVVANDPEQVAHVSREVRERFCAESCDAQRRFVVWILDRFTRDAPALPNGLHFDDQVGSCIQAWFAESKNLLAALAFASAQRSRALSQLLIRGYSVMRMCISPEVRVNYLRQALALLHRTPDSESIYESSDAASSGLASERQQCMLVKYMPQSEEEALLLQLLGASLVDMLHVEEAEQPLCQALRYFIGALARHLGVSDATIEKIDDLCLDEEIAFIQSGFCAGDNAPSKKPAPQATELTRKCQARMALLRLDMLLELYQRKAADQMSDVSYVTSEPRSVSASQSPSAASEASPRWKEDTACTVHQQNASNPRELLQCCVVSLLLLSLRIGLEGSRSEACDLLYMCLHILHALGFSRSTHAAATLLSLAGTYLTSGQLMRARDVCHRALDVLREGSFTHTPVYADALGMVGAIELIEGLHPAAAEHFSAALKVLDSWLDTYGGLPHEHCLNSPDDVQYLPLQHCQELHLWLSIGLARTCRAQQQHEAAERIASAAMTCWRRIVAVAAVDAAPTPKPCVSLGAANASIPSPSSSAYMEAVSLLPPVFQDFGNLRHIY